MGRDYFIKDENLKLVEDRKPGRPRKAKGEKAVKQGSRKKGSKK
jgi:hypothetical protein